MAAVGGALLVILAIIGTARLSSADVAAPDPAPAHEAIEAPDTSAEQCTEAPAATEPGAAAAEPGAGYECPDGVPYCYMDSQCDDYCGPPSGWGVCFQGCCTSAG